MIFKHASMLSKIKDSKKSFKKITQHGEGLITPSKQMQLPFFKTSITKCRTTILAFFSVIISFNLIKILPKVQFCVLHTIVICWTLAHASNKMYCPTNNNVACHGCTIVQM
ncbi:BED-type domain-containing protein [Aphis craccivora]|uniref:BED-type domain-containing protein n=1 Tax=Aphis craccivora TaxID=307492 RepID=A0A6G0Y616_APHCR|nr:BED-type domain-containing protein [Aphis craccivora]